MAARLPVIVFIMLSLMNVGTGWYLCHLRGELERHRQRVTLPAAEKEQRAEIERLIHDGTDGAVDRLRWYAREVKRKALVFAAITGIKRIDSRYANQKLRELLGQDQDEFGREMAIVAYKLYGYDEDVESLKALESGLESAKLRAKLKGTIERIQRRAKAQVDKSAVYAFVGVENQEP